MQVKKITITPLMNGCPKIVREMPSAEIAGILIKERLAAYPSQYNEQKSARVFRKLPAWMKGFVNPKALVSKERRFTTVG